MDTLNIKGLYCYNGIYYYRRRINGKLYRRSLKTKKLSKIIHILNILNKMTEGDLMDFFNLNNTLTFIDLGDGSYQIKKDKDEDEELFLKSLEVIQKSKNNTTHKNSDYITFKDIYDSFIDYKKSVGKVGLNSFISYRGVFNRINDFFGEKNLNNLNSKDKNELYTYYKKIKLKPKTINNHLQTLKQIFNYCYDEGILKHNFIKKIDYMTIDEVKKENWTDEELLTILKNDNFYSELFKIGIYSGCRISEMILLKKDDIKEIEGIKVFEIKKGKNKNSKRIIPIHKDLKISDFDTMIYKLNVKYSNEQERLKIVMKHTKNVNRLLKKIFPQTKKTFHNIRGSFIQKLYNHNPNDIDLIQMIVGHGLSESKKLTIQTYGKNVDIKILKNVVDNYTL